MIINKLDSIEFRLKELHDFTWLKKYGTAFWVVDQTGSGCICIGMQNRNKNIFAKLRESIHLRQRFHQKNLLKY